MPDHQPPTPPTPRGRRAGTFWVATALCLALGATTGVSSATAASGTAATTAAGTAAAAPADDVQVVVPNLDDVRGNLTLPTTGAGGSTLVWTSSAPEVVSADGVVTRPAAGASPVQVTLTVTATQDGEQASAVYPATVTPLPPEEELAGYFFPHFVGESTDDGEAVYFAASNGDDPLSWLTLNDGEPVLGSSLGEEGLRDPFIIRSPEGDRFFLLATDLKIYGGGNFAQAQETGSRSIMVWESDDLVTWSEQREVVVSPENAGNTWAPEAYYDESRGEYVVYWASALYPEDLPVAERRIADSYQRMMFATTRDFVTFSEPRVWIDEPQGPGRGMIDSTVAEEDGVYYRLTKDESDFTVRQERSTELTRTQGVSEGDGWELVSEQVGVGQPNPWGGTFTQGEGPTIFPSNTDDTWYLLQDQPPYHGGEGYMLFETDDLPGGRWTSVPEAELPASPRHGTVLPVTSSEHAALLETYQPDAVVESVEDVALTVQVGDAPILPATVPTLRGDGSTQRSEVTWDAVDPASYAAPGTFTVRGTLEGPTDLPATATVTVTTEPVPVTGLSTSPQELDLVVGGTADVGGHRHARQRHGSRPDLDLGRPGRRHRHRRRPRQRRRRGQHHGHRLDRRRLGQRHGGRHGQPRGRAGAAGGRLGRHLRRHRARPPLDRPHPRAGELLAHGDARIAHGALAPRRHLPGRQQRPEPVPRRRPRGRLHRVHAGQRHRHRGLPGRRDHRPGRRPRQLRPRRPHPRELRAGRSGHHRERRRARRGLRLHFTARPGSTSEHLRVQRVGDQVTTSYWLDGAWVEAGTVTVGFDMTQVGLYALAAGAAPSHTVRFDEFALVEPAGADQVPEGGFTLSGEGDDRYLVVTDAGLAMTDERPLVQTSFVATPVADPAEGTRPVTLADADTGLPLVVRGDRLALGSSGDEAAVVRLTDAGGGKVHLQVGERSVAVAEDGALVLGEGSAATPLTVVPVLVEEHTITVDTAGARTPFSPTMYGAFYEDINYAADGGLYAELVRNRSFEFDPADNASFTGLTAWEEVERGGATGSVTVERDPATWLNENNRSYLTMTSSGAGYALRNAHFNTGLAVEEGERYDFSVWARSTTAQDLVVTFEDATGSTIYGTATAAVDGSDTWKKYEVTVTATATTSTARLVVAGGAAGTLRLDMVSLFPQDTWVGPVNGRSVLRKDLAELTAALEPTFLRFPGGCVTNVGTFDTYLDSDGQDRRRTYQWKETIGPVEERPTNWNFWGYNQSYGLGYLEYMEWAEDLGASPLPVVSVGANGCGSTIPELTDEAGIQRWVDDTVDLLEFAVGGTDTEWGARRAELGHPEPFDVRYIGLGNEENTDTFQANFPRFRDAVEAAFPQVTVISNTGPDDTGARFDELFQFNRDQGVAMQDEHYYNDPEWFLQNTRRYDAYDRETDPDVFLGEYASRGNTHYNALSEAAYMTGLERNTDVVKLASYAPMFANEDYVQWFPDMMWFDNDEAWGSVSYYNQKMWMTVGADADSVVPSTHEAQGTASTDLDGGVFLSTWNTRAAYDDVTVTDDETGEVLFSDSFSDASAWSPVAGQWSVVDGEYVQGAGDVTDARSTVTGAYDEDWDNYTLELDARKLDGAEGFLVGFAAGGADDYYWWNLGGWNNTRSVLQRASGGGANEVQALEGQSLVTGQDYRLKIVVSGRTIELYLDGVLQMTHTEPTSESLYQVVTHDEETGALTLKVVNPTAATARTSVQVTGGMRVADQVGVTELVGAPGDTNSKADPTAVVPVERTWDGGAEEFVYDFPAYSVTFLELSEAEAEPTGPAATEVLGGLEDQDLTRALVGFVLAERPGSAVGVLADPDAPLTLFAPTDRAWTDLASDVDRLPKPIKGDEAAALRALRALGVDAVEELLLYHVVAGRTLDAADLAALAGTEVATADGRSLTPREDDGEVVLGDLAPGRDGHVVDADLNPGAPQQVHVVDGVLLPEKLRQHPRGRR